MSRSLSQFVLITLIISLSLSSSPGVAETLSGAFEKMLLNDPEISAASLDPLVQQQSFFASRGALRPTIELGGSGGYAQRDRSVDGLTTGSDEGLISRQVEISMRQLLWDGGSTRSNVQAEKLRTEVERHLNKAFIEQQALRLAETYLQILLWEQTLSKGVNHLTDYEDFAQQIKERSKGAGTGTDYELVRTRIDGFEITQIGNQQRKLDALSQFFSMVGNEASDLTTPTIPEIPTKLANIDLSQNWEYKAASTAREAAQMSLRASRSTRGPSLSLDLGLTRGRDVLGIAGEDNEARALVRGSWTLSNGGTRRAEVSRSSLMLRKADHLVRAADSNRTLEVTLGWRDIHTTHRTMGRLKQLDQTLARVESEYESQVTLGARTLFEVLDIKDQRFRNQSQILETEFRTQIAHFRLLAVQGRLVEWLRPSPPKD